LFESIVITTLLDDPVKLKEFPSGSLAKLSKSKTLLNEVSSFVV
jgi:hypothetical protein